MEQNKTSHLVITIGRQYGSGGREIGRRLAEKLGIGFYDNALVERAAEQAGLDPAKASEHDDKVSGKFFFGKKESGKAPATVSERMFAAQSRVIRQLADTEDCVIIGRCADYVLKGRENLLRVFIYADVESRAKRCIEEYHVQEAGARMDMRKVDKDRAAYYDSYCDGEWGSPENYDLLLNSELLGPDGCVEVIMNTVRIMQEK